MDIQIIDLQNHSSWSQILQKLRHDLYHLPEYVAIEAKRTETTPEAIAIIDGEKIFFAPYLLRSCDDIVPQELTNEKIFDVVSPYGYPGILLSESAANTPGFPDLALNEFKRVLLEKKSASVSRDRKRRSIEQSRGFRGAFGLQRKRR